MSVRSLAILLVVFASAKASWGQAGPEFDGLVGDQELEELLNQPAVLQLMTGVVIRDSQVVGFLKDRRTDSIQFVQYQDGLRKPKRRAADVYRLLIAGKPYKLRYNGPNNGYYLIDVRKAEADAVARLSGQDRELRDPQTADEIRDAVGEQKDMFNEAVKAMGVPQLAQYESQFGLLLTDFPEPAARQFLQYVDSMTAHMNTLFGVPASANIWRGKVTLAVFAQRPLFEAFEMKALNNPNFGTATTIYHSSSKRFLIVCNRKELGKALASSFCWSVAGGYCDRYRSSVRLPEWLRVGVREQVPAIVFPDPRKQSASAKGVARGLSRTPSLSGLLSATNIEDERRGLARMLVAYLMKQNPQSFSQFFEDVKLGHSWESALKSNYGATPEQFAAAFGQSLRVRGVTP